MEIDELIHEWKKFKLIEEEKEAWITLEPEEVTKIENHIDHNLVGKVLTNRNISKLAIKNAMLGAWKTRKDFHVETVSKNTFSFSFESKDDKEWINNNGPWLFDRNLVVLEAPTKNIRINELEFNKTDLWLRIINLPVGFRNEFIARKIGNILGTFQDWDSDKNSSAWGNSLRIRVRLDISKPLRRGFMLRTNGICKDCWISIRYERLPDLCFNCGKIGHVAKDCYGDKNAERTQERNFEYGSWMKFQGFASYFKENYANKSNGDETEEAQKGDENTEGEKRQWEGLDVDLNQASPINEEVDLSFSQEKWKELYTDVLPRKERIEEEIRRKAAQLRESIKEIEPVENNVDPSNEASGSASSSKKRMSWKRKKYMELRPTSSKDSLGSQKRKAEEINDNGGKRRKEGADDEMELGPFSENLAVAGYQPCPDQ